jgi:hypothetical protein
MEWHQYALWVLMVFAIGALEHRIVKLERALALLGRRK